MHRNTFYIKKYVLSIYTSINIRVLKFFIISLKIALYFECKYNKKVLNIHNFFVFQNFTCKMEALHCTIVGKDQTN